MQKKETKYKHSKQRDKILYLLKNTDMHPTADWIYNQLKGEFPNLSMGTVYRNLNILLEQNLIHKLPFGSTFDRFDGNTAPHHHFICEKCDTIFDIEIPFDDELEQELIRTTNFEVHTHRIVFYGLCEKCRKACK